MGVPPKPASQRRRRNKPLSYGAAEPVTAPAASPGGRELGFEDPHPLIADMWEVVQSSAESRFYSEADWARLRLELLFANRTVTSGRPTAQAWLAIQHGLSDMLISPAAKRRAAIEVKPRAPDTDEVAAVSMLGRYRQSLKPV